jgi:autotransporter-associated beta strand protein
MAGPVTLTGNTTIAVSSSATGAFTNANAITSANNSNLTLQGGLGAGGGGTISGLISLGTGSLTKQQGGTWTLSGAGNYSGGTNVTAGTLLVNGNGSTGIGQVSVSGGTLGGTGTITGDVVFTGGALAPGLSPGSLNMASLTMNNADYTWEYHSANTAQADVVNLTNNVANALSIGALVELVPIDWLGANAVMAAGTKFVLISYAHQFGWNGGLFVDSLNNPIPDGSQVLLGSQYLTIDYNDPNADDADNATSPNQFGVTLTIAAIPEASSIIVLGLGSIFSIGAVWLGRRMGFKVSV